MTKQIIHAYDYKDEISFMKLYNKNRLDTFPVMNEKIAYLISDLIYLENKTISVFDDQIILNEFRDSVIDGFQEGRQHITTMLSVLENAYDLILMQKEDGFLQNFTDTEEDIETLKLMVKCEKQRENKY